ncbi:FAD-dependent protein [Hydrogenoanaerobacterium sp.]|uniref:NAD(P)/FAD-dependent oxidoreductase n=1 Tax=Hydrogenoanaerobacterium sp. TaxID=2953763 RepID=UPI0028A271CC|nr:hypothetical protein [Hydrogenoanaerobacterium sp.]
MLASLSLVMESIMIVITGIRTEIAQGTQAAIERAIAELGIKQSNVKNSYIIKASVDARRRTNMSMVYSVGLELTCDEEEAVKKANKPSITLRSTEQTPLVFGSQKLNSRPVIAGFGPAGMFAGLLLAQNGYRPIILERGGDVDTRVQAVEGFWQGKGLDTATNVQFGEGGAGTFSDGKLITRINDPHCNYILREFVRFGAPQEILYKAKPHIGTDLLRGIVKAIRQEIISLGGEIRFCSQLEDFIISENKVQSVAAGGESLPSQVLVLAVGHSARDTFELLQNKQLALEVKPFSVGVRIEHLQSEIDKGLFGEFAGHSALGKGEYQLSHRRGERAVYTFCMCPGGTVVPSASEENSVVVNGMSEYARDKANANSALVVSVDSRDFGDNPMDAIRFQQRLERAAFTAGGSSYKAPAQTVGDFLKGRTGLNLGRVQPSYSIGTKASNMLDLFPQQITDMMRLGLLVFDSKIKGFAAHDAVLTGVETRTSSPVRILRNENGESISIGGLYPCGEGAGYAGGIMSAAVDGLKIAESIIQKYAPLE